MFPRTRNERGCAVASPNTLPESPAAIPRAAYVSAIPAAYAADRRNARRRDPPVRLPMYPTVTGRTG